MLPRFQYLLLLSILPWNQTHAQWVQYTVGNTSGLQANSVRHIVEDEEERLWIGTSDGLFRVNTNGTNWEYFGLNEGLPSTNITDLHYLEGQNKLLVTTDLGAVRQSVDEFIELNDPENLGVYHFTGVEGLSTSNMWVVTFGDGIKWRVNGSWNHHTMGTSLISDHYRSVFRQDDGTMWFGTTANGVSRFNNSNWSHFSEVDGLAGNTVLDIVESTDGKIWIAGNNGISYFDSAWHSLSINDGLSSENYFCLASDGNGNVWAGGENGIDVIGGNNVEYHLGVVDGLISDQVSAICHAADGSVWVGHPDNGVSVNRTGEWSTHSLAFGLASDEVLCSAESANGVPHFGHNSNISTISDGVWQNLGYNHPEFLGEVHDIHIDNEDTLWAVYSEGYAKEIGAYWNHYPKPFGICSDFQMASSANDARWFACENAVYRLQGNSGLEFFSVNTDLDGGIPKRIKINAAGEVWVHTSKGFSKFDGSSWTNYPLDVSGVYNVRFGRHDFAFAEDGSPVFAISYRIYSSSLGSQWATSLYKLTLGNPVLLATKAWEDSWWPAVDPSCVTIDSDQSIWVGFHHNNGGRPSCIRVKSNGEIDDIGETVGMTASRVNSILTDSNYRIWLSTNQGIFYSPLDHVGFEPMIGKAESPNISVFPNPSSSGQISLMIDVENYAGQLVVTDVSGQVVHQMPIQCGVTGRSAFSVDLGSLGTGHYILGLEGTPHDTQLIITNP